MSTLVAACLAKDNRVNFGSQAILSISQSLSLSKDKLCAPCWWW